MNEKLHAALVLIARQPAIRTVEIADKIDIDVDLVQPMLQDHLDKCKLILIPVTAPNGRPANGFMFPERFRKTDEFRALFEQGKLAVVEKPVQEEPKPQPAAPVVKVAAPAQAEPETPEQPAIPPESGPVPQDQEPEPELDGSRIDMVVRFIRANGSATRGEVRKLLGLKKGQYPHDYLSRPVADKRLTLYRGVYTLGPAIPDKFTERMNHDAVSSAPKAQKTTKASKATKAPATASQGAGVGFRCAMWSDGALELQRNGITIAILSDSEQATIMNFRRNVIASVTQGAV